MSYLYLATEVEQDNNKDKPSLPVVLFRPIIRHTENNIDIFFSKFIVIPVLINKPVLPAIHYVT